MIEAIIKVIDRLIQLRSIKDTRDRIVFDKIIEPSFNELLIIHSDYIRLFTEDRGMFDSYQDDVECGIKKLIAYLESRRIELEPVRVRLSKLAEKLENDNIKPEFKSYIATVRSYFVFDPKLFPDLGKSLSSQLIDRLKQYQQIPRTPLPGEVDHMLGLRIRHTRTKWAEVCEEFAHAKIAICKV